MSEHLSLWNDTPTRHAIHDFVAAVTQESGPDFIPPEERIAVFDNDGTLWCERPIQVQMDFILRRLAAMAEKSPSLRQQQPWQAAYTDDNDWFTAAVTAHYEGDDSKVKVLLGGILKAFGTMTVEAFEKESADFLNQAQHPSLGVSYMETTFAPMVGLLQYLEANGFTNYVVSGGGRDFMRPVTQTLYGIPPERVIGSAVKLAFQVADHGANIVRQADVDVIDDGPAKAVQIWERTGRRPVLAAGNANGDIPMLQYADQIARPSLCLLVNHDDAIREFDYTAGAEKAMKLAKEQGWTVVSVQQDWKQVFPSQGVY